tara:strand:- start:213 stop:668 length:456 start_codon:yes stop_codon:yes gene_type:complete
MGVSVTDVHTEALLPLGFEHTEPAGPDGEGEKTWIYVQMTGADTVIGSVCSFGDGAVTYVVQKSPINTHAGRVVGVAQHVIAQNSYGFILRKGLGLVLADTGDITANLGLMVGDAVGTADDAGAVTTQAFGIATAAISATATGKAFLSCVG